MKYNNLFLPSILLFATFIAGCTKDRGTLTGHAILQNYNVTIDMDADSISGSAKFLHYNDDVRGYTFVEEESLTTTLNSVQGSLDDYTRYYYWHMRGGLQDITVALSLKGKSITNVIPKNEFPVVAFPADIPDSLTVSEDHTFILQSFAGTPSRTYVRVYDSSASGYEDVGLYMADNGDVKVTVHKINLAKLKHGYAWIKLQPQRSIALKNKDGDEEAGVALSTATIKKIPLKK